MKSLLNASVCVKKGVNICMENVQIIQIFYAVLTTFINYETHGRPFLTLLLIPESLIPREMFR